MKNRHGLLRKEKKASKGEIKKISYLYPTLEWPVLKKKKSMIK